MKRSDPARALTELETSSPIEIRRQTLRVLCETVDADFGVCHGIAEAADGSRFLNEVLVEGPVKGLEEAIRNAPPEITNHFPIERLPDEYLKSFASTRALYAAVDFEMSVLYRTLWEPFGVTDVGGLLVFHGRSLIALPSVSWTRPKRFGEEDQRRLAPLVKPVQAAMTAAFFLARLGLPEEPAYVLLRGDGRIDSVSLEGEAWLERKGIAGELRRRVRDLDARREPAESAPLEVSETRIVRIQMKEGFRYLACLQPASWLQRPAEMILTPLQRSIAEATSAGMTIAEIADDLGRSPETVRDHLAAVYRKLRVSSRVELAAALRE